MAKTSLLRQFPGTKPHLYITELGTLNVVFPHWYTYEQREAFVQLLINGGVVTHG